MGKNNKSKKKQPVDADAHKALGNAAFLKEKFEEAIKHYTNGIEVDPTASVLYSNRA